MEQGITFDAGGPDAEGPVRDRPFPLDLVPRIIPAEEWTTIKRGLAQRIRALNAFIDDVYHGREIVHEGLVPWDLIVSRSGFARAAHGIRPPGGVYCHVSGCDLVRDADGSWKVLEDNVRTPSGISYVLENRVAMTRLLPNLFRSYRVRPVDHYPALLRAALHEVAPTGGEEEPTIVVWTPGPFNSAYFEHTFLARQMGVELVEATDLVVRDAVCYIRTTDGLQRVHAIYRRIDDDFMDPLEFRPDSLLGVPGLMRAYRAGHGGDRQRGRHGRRRRQGGLPLRARDGPLLPRRGADPRQRARRTCSPTPTSAARCSTASTRSWSSRRASPAARACSSARPRPTRRSPARPRRSCAGPSAGSPRSSCGSRPARPRRRTARSRRATSTCARSPCSARTSTSSPAA